MNQENIQIVNTEHLPDDVQSEYAVDDLKIEIKELINQYGGDDKFYVVLYKVDPVTGRCKQLSKYREIFPDSHEIGIVHGSGEYQVFINYPDPEKKYGKGLKKRRFSLGENYDELKRDNDAKKLNQFLLQKENHLSGNKNTNTDMFAMMQMQAESSNKMFMAMMQMQQQNSSNMINAIAALAPLLIGNKKESNSDLLPILLNQMNESNKEKFSLIKEGIEIGKDQNKEEKGVMDIVETIIENADKILSPWTPKSVVRKRIAENPEIQNIVNHEERFKAVRSQLVEKYGEEKTDLILNKAGIKQNQKQIEVKPEAKGAIKL